MDISSQIYHQICFWKEQDFNLGEGDLRILISPEDLRSLENELETKFEVEVIGLNEFHGVEILQVEEFTQPMVVQIPHI